MQKAKDLAQGRWYSILKDNGVGEEFLGRKHGPCPSCGGKDRYRFIDKDGHGTYYCNGCGPGDGFKLLEIAVGMEFKEAAEMIEKQHGNYPVQDRKPAQDPMKRINYIKSQVKKVTRKCATAKYLINRGVERGAHGVCHIEGLDYYNEDGEKTGRFPAMACPIKKDGALISWHLTYLTNDGVKADVSSQKKILAYADDWRGSSVKLGGSGVKKVVGEGVENTLAAMIDFDLPGEAALNTNGMENISLDGLEEIIIIGDNDSNYAGQKAAYILANRAVIAGVKTELVFSDVAGEDYLDMRNRWALNKEEEKK